MAFRNIITSYVAEKEKIRDDFAWVKELAEMVLVLIWIFADKVIGNCYIWNRCWTQNPGDSGK